MILWRKLSLSSTRNQSIYHLLVKIGNILRIKRTASQTIRLCKDEYYKSKDNQVIWSLKLLPRLHHVYDEKLVKPAMIACANEVLGKDAASTLSKISFSNDTITRKQNEMSNFVEEKIVEILQDSFLSRLMRAQSITKISFWSMSNSSMKMIQGKKCYSLKVCLKLLVEKIYSMK